jgi:hypothetical protein
MLRVLTEMVTIWSQYIPALAESKPFVKYISTRMIIAFVIF